MKTAEVIKAVEAGQVLFLAEVRGVKQETVEYLNKQTGQKASFVANRMAVEMADGTQALVTSREPFADSFVKGSKVVVIVQSMETDGGHITITTKATTVRPLVG